MGGTEHSTITKLFCGGISAGISKTITAPVERLKIILQTKTGSVRPGVFSTIQHIATKEGVPAFWKGNGVNCFRIVPTYALRLSFFDRFKSRNKDQSLMAQMWAGAYSGALTSVIVFPVDLVRTKLSADLNQSYFGAVDTVRKTIKIQGVSGLYQGFLISVIEITPYSAISLGGYSFLKQKFSRDGGSSDVMQNLSLGYICGVTASLFCYPMDTLKRRMMTSVEKVSVLRCTQDLLRKYGFKVFYRGCLINAMKSAPALAITLTTNDLLLNKLRERSQDLKCGCSPSL